MDSSQIYGGFHLKWSEEAEVQILCLSHTVITEHAQPEGPGFWPFLSCLPHFFPSRGGFTKLKHCAVHPFWFLLGSIIRQVLSSQIHSYNIISSPPAKGNAMTALHGAWASAVCPQYGQHMIFCLQHLPNFGYLSTTFMIFAKFTYIWGVLYLIFIFTLFSKF